MSNPSNFARPVYVVDGLRTPFLKSGGKPGPFTAADLAVAAGLPLLIRQPFAAQDIDEVILGCVAADADEANIARIAALRLGCGINTPAWTVGRNCASGLQAVDAAAMNIGSGRANLILAGGVEAMSHAPLLFSEEFAGWLGEWRRANLPSKLRLFSQLKLAWLVPVIGLLKGLKDPIVGMSMGQTAEKIVHKFGISRAAMDAYALRSHNRLAAAIDNDIFCNEITPIFDDMGNYYSTDNGLRRATDIQKLATLPAVFERPAGSVTAGNSAQISDGCAWLILASDIAVEKYKLIPRAKLIDCHWAGLEPAEMGLGPVHATTPLLQRHNLTINDIDYWEINEAFAGQVLACIAAWNDENYCRENLHISNAFGRLDQAKLNLHGGGISLGHPVGASGARIALHAINVLQRKNWDKAIATLCIGGGQGGAMLIQRVDNTNSIANSRLNTESENADEIKPESESALQPESETESTSNVEFASNTESETELKSASVSTINPSN